MEEIINKVCRHLPVNYTVALFMENGSAYVELIDPLCGKIELPDTADKTLTEQLNDALCVAKGWEIGG
ncbi:hypothetical protein LCGC14_1366430 [marine sediment metagenome]|uniref:Uncharacterized protein n=1 Tax=marine sediment metagenome TaxID=412755 RepID=A0A0F9K6P0_9ZZZZ